MYLDSGLEELKGIGEKTKKVFEKAGIVTISDLLEYYPRRYEKYEAPKAISSLIEGETVSIKGQLIAPIANRHIKAMTISTASCCDGNDTIQLTWFNMPYLRNSIKTGITYVFRGKVKAKGAKYTIDQPAIYTLEQYNCLSEQLIPVYSLVKGLTSQMIQKAIRQVIAQKDLLIEYLPEKYRHEYELSEYNYSIEQIHFPKDEHHLMLARKRLVFDEFFFFLLQLRSLKAAKETASNHFQMKTCSYAKTVIDHLPYQLTGAQKKVWLTILQEMQGSNVMARLIQGDVGSGKTIISILALLCAAENGYQGAIMVPTEVLANQHYTSITEVIEQNELPLKAVLLTGSMTAKQKREAYEKISSGEASVIIGTHALIQEKVNYHNLALVVTDEQHRFGVRQRELLSQKGDHPHTIVMSATPIPRTLAVILYGDLDISVINEMPSNRLPIKNCVVGTSYRPKAYSFIQKQVLCGHQAYVICPMVEESEAIEAENVISYAETLKQQLSDDIVVEYLHGKMKPKEKNQIMERFLQNQIQVLVSTTVVEVGVNVPNATVMMIENSERFGLAQLHQLRGRVGRGSAQSYCIFLHQAEGKHIEERLGILGSSNDGFEIANKDMQLRGPGDLFGVRQSGMLDFMLADVYSDADMLSLANEAVGDLMCDDPELNKQEHMPLRKKYDILIKMQSDHLNL